MSSREDEFAGRTKDEAAKSVAWREGSGSY